MNLSWIHVILLFGAVLGIAMIFGAGMLLSFHIELVLTNQTTVEYYENMGARKKYKKIHKTTKGFKTPYDVGVKENIWEVYGDNLWFKILVPTVIKSPVSGFYWENKKRKGELNMQQNTQNYSINLNNSNNNNNNSRKLFNIRQKLRNENSPENKNNYKFDVESNFDMGETQADMMAKIETTMY